VKLASILALQNDLALALAAHPLRIEAPIPGKALVGIEVPNKAFSIVRLRNLASEDAFQKNEIPLLFSLGRDVTGHSVFANLAKMPHMLIAGATGTGKSVCIHSILSSLLLRNSPDALKMILIDPKRIELSHYNGIPHLLTPVICDYKKVPAALKWAIMEMERRYQLLLEYNVRDLEGYNIKAIAKGEEILPYILIVIDELADLMVQYGKEVEGAIIRLAQMARATGTHIIVSTQRPSVEVITGLIKANVPARIAFAVASQIDSRTILDMAGAEKLLGHGDMLYLPPDNSKPTRLQGAYVSEKEVERLVEFWGKQLDMGENELSQNLEQVMNAKSNPNFINLDENDENGDELYDQAYEVVVKAGKASASLLQRRLRVGYARAARLLDLMEEKNVIGPADGAKPREVYEKFEE
ncbi:MAG: DNA translocase FtsK, partial [Candidatus Parcubacteria bacterium]|nr:DNA translocase FtsK [Candidatus Parcubacteria bacterium]